MKQNDKLLGGFVNTYNRVPTLEKHTIKCSSCQCPIVNIVVDRPELKTVNHIVAKCPHCGDRSFQTTIQGGISFARTDYCLPTPYPELDSNGKPTHDFIVESEKLLKWVK